MCSLSVSPVSLVSAMVFRAHSPDHPLHLGLRIVVEALVIVRAFSAMSSM
jgi:hypothetical protein